MNDRERKDNDLGIDLDLDMKGLTLDSDDAAKPQAQNRPMSHEDMARMIAKNMAMQDGGFDEPITPVRGVSDFGEETVKPKKPKTTETRSKNAKPASKQTSKNSSRKSISEASNVARRTRRTSVDASLFVRIKPLCQRESLMVTLYRNCSPAVAIPLWFLEKNGQRHKRKESLSCSSAIQTSKKPILSYTLYA